MTFLYSGCAPAESCQSLGAQDLVVQKNHDAFAHSF